MSRWITKMFGCDPGNKTNGFSCQFIFFTRCTKYLQSRTCRTCVTTSLRTSAAYK